MVLFIGAIKSIDTLYSQVHGKYDHSYYTAILTNYPVNDIDPTRTDTM